MTQKRVALVRDCALLVTSIVALAAIGVALPAGPFLRFAIIAPVAYTLAIIGDIATAIILVSTWRYDRTRATLVLALSFTSSAVVLFLASLMLPLLPAEPPLLSGPVQSGIWLYVFWHVSAALGALVYAVLRRDERSASTSRAFTIAAPAIALAMTVGWAIAAFTLVRWLPVLTVGTNTSGLVSTGIGPIAAALLALAAFFAFRIPGATAVDRAVAFSTFALSVEMSMLVAGVHRYSAAYYAGRVFLVFAQIFVLVCAIRSLIDARVRLRGAEQALTELSQEASERAGRIRALWEIALQNGKPAEHIFDELLRTATTAFRPGKTMFGILAHLEDDAIVIDATCWSAPASESLRFRDVIFPGARFALEGTLAASLLAVQHTCAWDELPASDHSSAVREQLGWRSYIGKHIAAGSQTYILGFASLQSMTDQPFAADDSAYVDLIASFLETRFSEKLHYERLQFQIEHDALTGLHSRAQFRTTVRDAIEQGSDFAIAIINLDEFRIVNEQHGHLLGDEILVEIAAALERVNSHDLVARMNGDEFGILLRGLAGTDSIKPALDAYARQFLSPFRTSDRADAPVLKISASIGAARFPKDALSPEDLMRRANLALSYAKEQGGATTTVFHSSMEASLEASRMRLVELADAIASDQLTLLYQPTFDLATREVVGAEALVRWDHPERGRLLPAEFVTFAEHNGLIASLTRWVFWRVVRDFSGGAELPHGFRVYFNVVAQTLDDFTFIAEMNDALRATPRLADHLGIELTETAAMENFDSAMHTINLLRTWGLSVAIDDFGTGYSSLSYAKKLTVDVIKIDRSFVSGLPYDESDGAIAELLLQFTGKFDIVTLAEGIETEAQASWLLEHGCRLGQGYLFAKPEPLPALRSRLRERTPSSVRSSR